jgi:hypothetical protein
MALLDSAAAELFPDHDFESHPVAPRRTHSPSAQLERHPDCFIDEATRESAHR